MLQQKIIFAWWHHKYRTKRYINHIMMFNVNKNNLRIFKNGIIPVEIYGDYFELLESTIYEITLHSPLSVKNVSRRRFTFSRRLIKWIAWIVQYLDNYWKRRSLEYRISDIPIFRRILQFRRSLKNFYRLSKF